MYMCVHGCVSACLYVSMRTYAFVSVYEHVYVCESLVTMAHEGLSGTISSPLLAPLSKSPLFLKGFFLVPSSGAHLLLFNWFPVN